MNDNLKKLIEFVILFFHFIFEHFAEMSKIVADRLKLKCELYKNK